MLPHTHKEMLHQELLRLVGCVYPAPIPRDAQEQASLLTDTRVGHVGCHSGGMMGMMVAEMDATAGHVGHDYGGMMDAMVGVCG